MAALQFLSPQELAIRHVAAQADGGPLDPQIRITISFHPDARVGAGTVIEALRGGVYRSQFETGTSSGGLTAFVGGDRWRWESHIFAGAYDHSSPETRPKYGALNHRRDPRGASPRFGSCYLRLRGEVLKRATFCFPDSYFEPQHFGTWERASHLLTLAETSQLDVLDNYIEAQVHGPLILAQDVEAMVLDPCYRGSVVEEVAHHLPLELEWHPGFVLTVGEMERHPAYRGAAALELGRALAQDGRLDALLLGQARHGGGADPQALKWLWHYIARFGRGQETG